MDWAILATYVGGALFVSATCSLLEAVLTGVNVIKLKAADSEASRRMLSVREHFTKASAAILSLNTVAHTIGASLAAAYRSVLLGKNQPECPLAEAMGEGRDGGLLRDVEFCHKEDHASDLLDCMVKSDSQLGVVLDEHESVVGRVSLETFWEFLLGVDIRDEDD